MAIPVSPITVKTPVSSTSPMGVTSRINVTRLSSPFTVTVNDADRISGSNETAVPSNDRCEATKFNRSISKELIASVPFPAISLPARRVLESPSTAMTYTAPASGFEPGNRKAVSASGKASTDSVAEVDVDELFSSTVRGLRVLVIAISRYPSVLSVG